MHWYNPDAATEDATVPGCAADPIRYRPSALTLHFLLYGSLDNRRGVGGVGCSQLAGTAAATQFQLPTDFTDWKMVTIRKPNAGEAVSAFYDLPALRNASELVLQVPRVGFFTTPAFFANWQTNISNQARVTMNQTLIVALGAQVDGTDSTVTPGNPPPGLDTVHAGNAACAVCHQTLDPLRSIFAATYSWNYHEQTEAIFSAQKGVFSFHGVIQPVSAMADLGQVLAQHPLFPSAWAQKLCAYANSAPCADSDPEFQRIVAAFQASSFDWNTLVRELLSSPITTNASQTATAVANGQVVAVARRDHLCGVAGQPTRLRRRLRAGCGDAQGSGADGGADRVAACRPTATARGSTMPVLPNQPSLFFHAGTENICNSVAGNVIDVAAAQAGRRLSDTGPAPRPTPRSPTSSPR